MAREVRLTPTGQRVTDEERWWQRQANEWRRSSLDRTRGAADRWIKAIGAITGLFGLLTIFQGAQTLEVLPAGYRVAIGALLLVTMLAALAAIALGALAARGRLERTLTSAGSVQQRYQRELRAAVRNLRASFFLAFGALLPLFVAVGLAWFAPRSSKYLVVTRGDGSSVCVPRPPAGTSVTLPLESVTAVAVVSRCPR